MTIPKPLQAFAYSLLMCCSVNTVIDAQEIAAYKNPALSHEERAEDLLKQLRLEEKVNLLGYQNKAVPRLGIPAYNWWNEALHGVARAGEATVFPQAIGMAATFDDTLLQTVADAISTEARAKFNIADEQGAHRQYFGLTFWSPNINIFRDPRWGRGQETYGEDPYLTGRMGTAFVHGLQGNDRQHLKAAACAKHFAVHSGPEKGRGSFNAIVTTKDLRETYLPAFNDLVNAGVETVMGAYNRVNGEPCNTSKTLIGILRKEWGFKGHLVTDCGALDNIWHDHKAIPTRIEVAAEAIKRGVNLDCSTLLQEELMEAFKQKLVTEKEVDQALKPLLLTQLKLGFYDDPKASPYANYGVDSIRNVYHVNLAREMARKSMVLLKNENQVLPLAKQQLKSIFVTGPGAFNADVLLANYRGMSSNLVTFAEGISKSAGPGVAVKYEMGCTLDDTVHFGGINNAQESDVTLAVIGLSPLMEGEEGDAFLSRNAADKLDLSFPMAHVAFLKALRAATKKPIIAVVTGGSALDMAQIEPYTDAIIMAWYPGEQGGNALADLVFGDYSPSGKLPVTFYQSVKDLPDYRNYNMTGRTYRYFQKPVPYPFGYGLSYTNFSYQWNKQPEKRYRKADTLRFAVTIANTGAYAGDEVVQAYIQYPQLPGMPFKELKQFKRISIPKGGQQQVQLEIPLEKLQKWNEKKQAWELYPGNYELVLGEDAQDAKLTASFQVH
ncbi:glycoside hydrolase family 3 C-terminal domain-containing protein [Olivibacter ginsenosidimutans]|uniref:Glycoside hydrolase family 3 C-terminal domain-containing protein n=2 Tax=Olivibacter ginsenosidimutans TaxID=1176537 RepID=A0ABP9BC44_9SPHI